MENYLNKVKDYLLELEYSIVKEDKKQGIFIIENEENLIKNMIVAIEDNTVILEQPLFQLKKINVDILKSLLKKNRELICGALALDENNTVIYRDTLQVENLDLNELEASLNSLTLLLSEAGEELLSLAK